jgi:hypothetical protein
MSYLTNCPPCDANFPILCEPLETTAKGKRLVVEDAAACQKTIQTPTGQQILKTDGAGNLSWTNGANDTVLTKSATGVIEFTVISNQIPDGSITNDKLAGAAVTEPKIATDAVTSSKIANLSVTAGKLGANEQKQICKAWVNFNGTTSPGTIRSSYNVSSVTRTATGEYNVNFATPMVDANYSATTTTIWTGGPYIASVNSASVNLVGIVTGLTTGISANLDRISVQVFGN